VVHICADVCADARASIRINIKGDSIALQYTAAQGCHISDPTEQLEDDYRGARTSAAIIVTNAGQAIPSSILARKIDLASDTRPMHATHTSCRSLIACQILALSLPAHAPS